MSGSSISPGAAGPYSDPATNTVYNWLFCDDINLFKTTVSQPERYPWNILFSPSSVNPGLQTIIDDAAVETRARMLAYNMLRQSGCSSSKKELLAVIVEVGLDDGLDVLAAFKDGTARYINQSGKMIIWEAASDEAGTLIKELFASSIPVIQQIGPWNNARRPHPETGMARISFLVSDGLYFGEAPMNALFDHPLAKPALLAATALMQFLTVKVLDKAAN